MRKWIWDKNSVFQSYINNGIKVSDGGNVVTHTYQYNNNMGVIGDTPL